MPKTHKEMLQEKIRNEFSDQVKANQERLCPSCGSFWTGYCDHGLLPVTSQGQDCPYYKRGE